MSGPANEQMESPKQPIPTPSELETQQHTQELGDTSVAKVPGEDEISFHDSNTIIVDWDGENDPANPMNWPKAKRISQAVLVSAITMVTLVSPLRVSVDLQLF
jgi:hypothetical protein